MKGYFWMALNVLAILLCAVILVAPIDPGMRIVFVILLTLNSAALPSRISAIRHPKP